MRIFLPDSVKTVLDTLHKNGFEAYIVGGCVRDALCHIEPHDYDVTTAALPETVERLFEHTAATGLKHGTVTVLSGGQPIEVTTFRTESGYADHRRPDRVDFVSSLRKDLARRDFTVNAMAYDEEHGVIDPFDGQSDLKNKILRAVGDADTRFDEDALRILRLFRFASVLRFSCEEKTLHAAFRMADGLQKISRERITEELKKAVMGDILRFLPLVEGGALAFIGIDKIGNFSYWERMPDHENLRLCAFLQETATDFSAAISALKLSNAQKEYCLKINELCKLDISCDNVLLKRILAKYEHIFFDYVNLMEARSPSDGTLYRTAQNILASGEPFRLQDLCVTGDDLIARGFRGAAIGQALEQLLDAVIEDPEKNNRETLLSLL